MENGVRLVKTLILASDLQTVDVYAQPWETNQWTQISADKKTVLLSSITKGINTLTVHNIN